jgi:hypothetical protein
MTAYLIVARLCCFSLLLKMTEFIVLFGEDLKYGDEVKF